MEKLRVYLASQYDTRCIFRGLRPRFERSGLIVQARWIDTDEDLLGPQTKLEDRERWIFRDLQDLASCDVMIAMSMKLQHGYGTGGRHVEFGYALAIGKPIVLVGEPENLFHFDRRVTVIPNLESIAWAVQGAYHRHQALTAPRRFANDGGHACDALNSNGQEH